jgi:hypothetical protein
MKKIFTQIGEWLYDTMLAVPVRTKVVGIGLLPVLILGFSLNYWITTGLSDWLSYILTDVRVQAAMAAGARSVFFVTILGQSFPFCSPLFWPISCLVQSFH